MQVDAVTEAKVIELRQSGQTFDQIGKSFGKNDSWAWKIVCAKAPELKRVKKPRPAGAPDRFVAVSRRDTTLGNGILESHCYRGDLVFTFDGDDPEAWAAAHARQAKHIKEVHGKPAAQ